MNNTSRNWFWLAAGVAAACALLFLCVVVAGAAVVFFRQDAAPSFAPGGAQPTAVTGPQDDSPPRGATGGVLRIPGADPPTLDPALASDATSAEYIVELFSGLVTLSPDDLSVQPDIAERWEISDDGTVYTFYLRQDVTFANGKPVTAEDFRYTIERACDPKTQSPVAHTYLGDIVGCRDKLEGQVDSVDGVRVVDDYTLEITIEAPKVYFLAKLTYPTAFVVDREAVEQGGRAWAAENPNGTGPFTLERYTFGEELILVPNERYYGEPKPALERVIYSLAGGSIMTRYETDELDVVPVGLADIERVLDPSDPLNQDLVEVETLSLGYLGLNNDQPPFDDPEVRKAFTMALDRERLARVVLRETVQPAHGILPPGLPGYNPDVKGYEYDPQAAQEALANSSYGGPEGLPDITIHVPGRGGAPPQTVEAIVEMWRQNLGVEVAIEQTEWATFLFDINKTPNPYQIYDIGWIADYPDPQNFLEILFSCESQDNHLGYCNPDVDALLQEAAVEQDQQKRFELYSRAEALILQDAPIVPLWYGKEFWLVKPWVKNMRFPSAIVPRLKYVSVER
ncbi:MAG: peptide ABC transporter substrate-binding protein [Ardenticatenia bacterium]|nr:peptide ABC transporter substrate-binding protein [Ardenticatenia bacterium]